MLLNVTNIIIAQILIINQNMIGAIKSAMTTYMKPSLDPILTSSLTPLSTQPEYNTITPTKDPVFQLDLEELSNYNE